jgi:enamine deaminase RidA (YjgF/YER057c/UK114 family)
MRYYFLFLVLFTFSCTNGVDEDLTTSIPNVDYDKILDSLGIDIPEVSSPIANYVNIVQSGNMLFLAGEGPKKSDGTFVTGKVGENLTIEQGYQAAQLTAQAQLAVLKDYLGDLNKVKRIVKVFGMVNCTSDFTNQPEVINGFSDTMVAVFREKGKHARAAVGMASLPRGIAVEVDVVVEIY